MIMAVSARGMAPCIRERSSRSAATEGESWVPMALVRSCMRCRSARVTPRFQRVSDSFLRRALRMPKASVGGRRFCFTPREKRPLRALRYDTAVVEERSRTRSHTSQSARMTAMSEGVSGSGRVCCQSLNERTAFDAIAEGAESEVLSSFAKK